MKASFWHKCWERDHIGFHQQSPHPLLTQLWQQWTQGDCSTVFVPLCGKSGDMVYIANTNKVIGAELSDIACRDFYVENGLEYTTGQQPHYLHYQAITEQGSGIDLYQGDFFALDVQDVEGCQLVYDRAALIALPETLRAQYVAHLRSLFGAGTKLFLLALEYPQGEIEGPPFNVPCSEIDTLFARCKITRITDAPLNDVKFAQRKLNVSSLIEVAYFIEF